MDWKYIAWRFIRAPWFFFLDPYKKTHDDCCILLVENKDKFNWHTNGFRVFGTKENGDEVSFWSANKFYAYAKTVVIYHAETKTETMLTNGRPSPRTMYRLYTEIERPTLITQRSNQRGKTLESVRKVFE